MDELIFRGRDRYRPSWSHLAILLVVLVVQSLAAWHQLGREAFLRLTGGMLLLAALALRATVGSWSRVGPGGITICWGFGRGRTYPWDRIRWIDVRTVESTTQVRMFLVGGRRRALPGLLDSDLYPSPDFDEQYHRIRNWWELNTEAPTRVEPGRQFRDRITVTVAALLATPVVIAVAAAVFFLRNT